MCPIDLSRRADEVAPALLGAVLRRGPVAIRLTEVEAYLGMDDPASHAYRGPHGRAATMFGEPGCLYVYLSYGIHLAANLVCSPAGSASAVLLRSGEVIDGLELACERRGWDTAELPRPISKLASGPGNLGSVLGLTLSDDGARLGAAFTLEPGPNSLLSDCHGSTGSRDQTDTGPGGFTSSSQLTHNLDGRSETTSHSVMKGPRTGISKAPDWPLRYWLSGEKSVSPYRRSPKASRPDIKA